MRPGHPNGPSQEPVKHRLLRMMAGELRHSAEREYAASLDAKGLPWVYEPVLFRFAGHRYTPDFYLPIQDIFVEVIGTRQRWHQLSPKMAAFKAHFPGVKLQILDRKGAPWPLKISHRMGYQMTADEACGLASELGISAETVRVPGLRVARDANMTKPQLLAHVEAAIRQAGSAKNLADQWGVSPAYISDVRAGKREPGPAILRNLGLSATTSYAASDGRAS